MTSMAQIRYFPLVHHYHHHHPRPFNLISFNPPLQNRNFSLSLSPKDSTKSLFPKLQSTSIRVSSGGPGGGSGADGGGGWSSGDHGGNGNSDGPSRDNLGCIGLFFKGWQSGVAADTQCPSKVAMEERVGIIACILCNLASHPCSRLHKPVFDSYTLLLGSTLIFGSTLSFVQMCLLTPPLSVPHKSHMFGSFMGKLALLAAVGFVAGLAGTTISNTLIAVWKKMDPDFETPNKALPLLNDSTRWFCVELGAAPDGVEFAMARSVSPFAFKAAFSVLNWFILLACATSVATLSSMADQATAADASNTPNDEGSQSDK